MKKRQAVVHPSAWSDKRLRGLVMSDGWLRKNKFIRPHASPLQRRILRAVKQWKKRYWAQTVLVIKLDV